MPLSKPPPSTEALSEVPSRAWEHAALASLGSQTLPTASHPQQSHKQSCSILSVSWQDFAYQIITFRRRFGTQLLDAWGSMSAASTSPLSSSVTCKVEACSSKSHLALVFFSLGIVTNCALSHVLFFMQTFFTCFLGSPLETFFTFLSALLCIRFSGNTTVCEIA